MAVALFCSPKYVKQKSIIDGELDNDKLTQYIQTAQDKHIQNYLGTELYNKINDLIVDDEIGDAGNADYLTLLSTYIKPMLAWYTQAEFYRYAPYSVKNGGIHKHVADNSELPQSQEIDKLVMSAMDNAIFYTNRLLDYLCENSSLYSEYNAATDGMYPDKDTNYVPWVL